MEGLQLGVAARDCVRHGGHRGYSSASSQTIRDASVPPTDTTIFPAAKKRTQEITPEYTFASF